MSQFAISLSTNIAFDVSKVGRVEVDVARLTPEQIEGALAKGLHEFLKDAHAGVTGDDESRKAVMAKLQRLYDGAVPGLGRTGGGGRALTPVEKEMRAIAERKFAGQKAFRNATAARKAAMDYEATLGELARTARPDWTAEQVDGYVSRVIAGWRTEAEATIARRDADLPDLIIE